MTSARAALCIIPARGGSKRIPRKNIRPLAGRPLIAHAIERARACGEFEVVMVSTDDAEIAAVARQAGAEVPFLRSASLADDHASTQAVIADVLEQYRLRGRTFALACCLYPAAVLLADSRLSEARTCLDDESCDGVLTLMPFEHPIERAFRLQDGCAVMVDESTRLVRTQDFAPSYHDAGQFYWFRPARFLATGKLVGARSAAVVLSRDEAVDLDTESDWRRLEWLASNVLPPRA
ncbi:pseudaminic acid cytidylyltransferase [Gemmatimonas sp.]|uniref:pseudaminic acid cytidylyltransferase n=1 Tax=Gemmatimonas sp. TaxID=1962908 RepID=UPI0037C09DDC